MTISLSVSWKAGVASYENKTMELDMDAISGILPRGGTILRTSRTNPAKRDGGLQRCMENLRTNGAEALIAIGGDDTMSVAQRMFELGLKVVGVPKTIDNDLMGTDFCFGFDTAVNTATEAIDRVHTTAEAHQRVIVVEVMGRDSGWIAMYSGIAGGADVILIPERPFDIEEVAERIRLRHSRGRYFSIVVVAEGAKFASDVDTAHGAAVVTDLGKDEFGHVRLGGIGQILARELEHRTGLETRNVVLGPHPARRNTERFRSRAGFALWNRRYRPGPQRRIRSDGRPPGNRHRRHSIGRCHSQNSPCRSGTGGGCNGVDRSHS